MKAHRLFSRQGCTAARDLLTRVLLVSWASLAHTAPLPLLEDAVLRSERGIDAPVVERLTIGKLVEPLRLRGGWALVEVNGRKGWVRASQLALALPEAAAVSRLNAGRLASGATAVSLGVRSIPARITRHALIFGVGNYQQDPQRLVPPLAGVKHDVTHALAIARRMQVPPEQVTLLRDAEVTRARVEEAIRDLQARVQPGDRVFVYWSGHGSRYFDAEEGGCVETLLPHDLRDISNRQFAQWLKPLAAKADKLMVVYDACHSGGIGGAATRSWPGAPLPKFTQGTGACLTPSNVRSRSLASATQAIGIDGRDVVHLSSSRADEVSFDFEDSGGAATSALLACMSGETKDLDGSGAVSVDEVVACAQPRIESAMAPFPQFVAQHLVVSGNGAFVPSMFASDPRPPAEAAVSASTQTDSQPSVQSTVDKPAATAPAALSLVSVLDHLHAQRDTKRRVVVSHTADRLRIGADRLDFSISSSHDGYVYVFMLGSDEQSLVQLFPNTLDGSNRIAVGETMLLPRANWQLTAAGPRGTDRVLVMVTDGPRDLVMLGGTQVGPFVKPLTDPDGRSRLQSLLVSNPNAGKAVCAGAGCSDAFGSALFSVEEY